MGQRTSTESKPARKILLLGKSGAGKSSSGHTIFGEHTFETESSPDSITAECTTKSGKVDGREVTIIDTPGIFDTHHKVEDIRSGIISSITECDPPVDAFVIVLKVENYTSQEKEILKKIFEYCGEDIFKHVVILFTHGEELKGQKIEQFVQQSPTLQELVDKCGGRCHAIDNKQWNNKNSGYKSNKFQVKNLLNTIDKMVEESGHYTKEQILKIEEKIIEGMMKEKLKKIFIRSAGVASGTLTGAFMGIGVSVVTAVRSFKEGKGISFLSKAITDKPLTKNRDPDKKEAEGTETAAARVGIAAGVVCGAGAFGGAIGGGITGFKETEEADSVLDAIKIAAKVNYENSKEFVKTGELPSNFKNYKLN